MDVVTVLKSLADAKIGHVKAWKQAQGSLCADYDDLTRQVGDLSFGALDGKVADLRSTEGAEIPNEVRQLLLEAIKNTALQISETPLGKEAFKGSDIVYYVGGESPKTSLQSAFESCKMLLLVEGLDLTGCTSTSNMFHADTLLRRVEFSAPVNPANVSSMFYQCSSLENVEFPAGSLKSITSTELMFRGCTSLKSVSFPEGSLSNIRNMDSMFGFCSSLTSVVFPKVSLSKVSNINNIFDHCELLDSDNIESVIDLLDWSYIKNAYAAFRNSNLSSFNHPETVVEAAGSMFQSSKIQSVTVALSKYANSDYRNRRESLFANCTILSDITLKNGLPLLIQAYGFFKRCSALTSVKGLSLPSLCLSVSDYPSQLADGFALVVEDIFSGCTSLVDCELGGTLYKSGVDLRPCVKLSARSLYTWVDALYDWASNPEEKTTDDTDHTLYLTDAQQTTLQDYTGDDGESGEDAYLTALDRGWTISA